MEGNDVKPLDLDTVKSATSKIIAKSAFLKVGDWPGLAEEDVAKILPLLASKVPDGSKPVYIAGGVLYSLDEKGMLASKEHPAAAPYMWPIAHDVRPAAQSLGARKCEDCHSAGTPFFYGKVLVDSPVREKAGALKEMKDLYEVDVIVYPRVNLFFKWLIIVVMTLLIMHILGDLYRRILTRLFKKTG